MVRTLLSLSQLAWLAALLSTGLVGKTEAYPGGAPANVCGTMVPGVPHGSVVQTGASPFTVSTNIPATYALNGVYTVTITSTTVTFKGFFCQTRDAATGKGSSVASTEGSFTPPAGTHNVNCNSNPTGGVTHSSRLGGGSGVMTMSLTWTAPSTPNKNLVMLCTVVQDRYTFWVQVASTGQYAAPAPAATTPMATMASMAPTTTTVATTTMPTTTPTTPAPTTVTAAVGIPTDILTACSGASPTKYCATLPASCDGPSDCNYIYTHTSNSTHIDVELFGRTTAGQGWVGIGYSLNNRMIASDVFACDVDVAGTVNVKNMHTSAMGYSIQTDSGSVTNFVTKLSGVQASGQLYCKLSRPIDTGAPTTDDYDLSNNFTLLFPRRVNGNAAASALLAGIHTTRPTVSANQVSASSRGRYMPPTAATSAAFTGTTAAPATAVPTSIVDNCTGTNATKFCVMLPNGCNGTAECNYIYTQRRIGTDIEVELFGVVNSGGQGWVAIAYSQDQEMGNDDVLACDVDVAGVVNAKNLHNVGRSNSLDNGRADNNITKLEGTRTGNKIYCRFRRPLNTGLPTSDDYDLTQSFYQLYGRRTNGAAQANAALVGIHTTIPTISSSKQSAASTGIGTATSKNREIVKAHGIMMVLAWVFAAAVGVFVAAWMKKARVTEPGQTAHWFVVHRFLMVTVWLLTCVAFIIIFVDVGRFTNYKTHGALGIVTFILAFIQPFIALARCAPDDDNRWIFNAVHRTVGILAKIIGGIAIYFGIKAYEGLGFNIEEGAINAWIVFMVFEGVFGFGMLIYTMVAKPGEIEVRSDMELKSKAGEAGDAAEKPLTLAADYKLRRVVFLLHALETAATAIAICVFIGTANN